MTVKTALLLAAAALAAALSGPTVADARIGAGTMHSTGVSQRLAMPHLDVRAVKPIGLKPIKLIECHRYARGRYGNVAVWETICK